MRLSWFCCRDACDLCVCVTVYVVFMWYVFIGGDIDVGFRFGGDVDVGFGFGGDVDVGFGFGGDVDVG